MPSQGVYKRGKCAPKRFRWHLATDRTGARKGSDGAIAWRDVIANQNATSEALRGLGQRPGGGGRSSFWGKQEARLGGGEGGGEVRSTSVSELS